MSARIGAPLDSAASTDQAFSRGISQTWDAPVRPAARRRPARRPLAPAVAILGAPAVVIVALVAFGSLTDRGEAGLGSLPAASGLQGSAVPAPEPEPATKPDKQKDRDQPAAEASGRERGVQRNVDPRPGPCAQLTRGGAGCREGGPPAGGGFTPPPAPRRVPGPGEPGSLSSGSTGGTSPGGTPTSGSGSTSSSSGSGSGDGSVDTSGTDSGSD